MEPITPIQSVERVPEGSIDPSGRPVSPPNIPVDYLQRFQALALKPDFSDTIFAHIANGGTLITLAEIWGVRHSDISAFLGNNPALMPQYTAAMMARDEWERERCLQELRAIATVDIRQAYNEDGTIKSMRDMPANVAAALSSVETDELFEGTGTDRELVGYTKKVKFWDKAKAIELFMKKHGLLIERKHVTVARTLEDILSASLDDVVDAQVVAPSETPKEIPKGGGGTGGLETQNHSV